MCNSCKPGGRGPKCAAWFLEHVRSVVGDNDMQVMSLEGGIKGWVNAGPEYTQLMDGFEEHYWRDALGKDDKAKNQNADVVHGDAQNPQIAEPGASLKGL